LGRSSDARSARGRQSRDFRKQGPQVGESRTSKSTKCFTGIIVIILIFILLILVFIIVVIEISLTI